MENEEITQELAEDKALLSEYQKLKENSVSKEKYEADIKALKDKNELYLKAITEGDKVDTSSEEDSTTVQDDIAKLSRFKGTNLEFWDQTTKAAKKALKALPKDVVEKSVGADGLDEIVNVVEGMRDMVDRADGDPDYFRTLFKREVQESSPRMASEINKAGGLVEYLEQQQNKK